MILFAKLMMKSLERADVVVVSLVYCCSAMPISLACCPLLLELIENQNPLGNIH